MPVGASIADDLHFDRVNATERAAIYQIAALQLQIELMQDAIVRGDAIETDEMIRLSGEVRRLLNSLRRRAKDREASKPRGVAAYLENSRASA
jgi:hypothetical protein